MYELGVTPFATLDMERGTFQSRPYLLCTECGQMWTDIEGKLHLIKREHDCPAMKESREAAQRAYALWQEAHPNGATLDYVMDQVGMAPAPEKKTRRTWWGL